MTKSSSLSPPTDAFGALYFLPGQYLFKRLENGHEITKALSSEQISRAFREYRTDSGWICRNLLRYREEPEGNSILSFELAGIRRILVERSNGEVSEITLSLPTLVLLGYRNEYYLWAAKDKRISETTKLAIAPLPNIGGNLNGKICFGTNEVPEVRIENLDAVWKLIFSTPFNRDQANNKCLSKPDNVREFLFELSDSKAKRFPSSELIETDTTIEELWNRVVENKGNWSF